MAIAPMSEHDAGIKFGSFIRAPRLGWHWSAHNGAWLRLSFEWINGKELVAVELAPPKMPPKHNTKSRTHVCWWDNPDCLQECPRLMAIRRVKRYIKFYER